MRIRRLRSATIVAASFLFLICGPALPDERKPMYGGSDRASIPELKAADDRLIADGVRPGTTRAGYRRRNISHQARKRASTGTQGHVGRCRP